MRLHHLPRLRPTADPVRVRVPIGQGLAHHECLIEKAAVQQAHRGGKVWSESQTCGPAFTGAMRTGLAEAWWSRGCAQAEESIERLASAHNLADCRHHDGEYAVAEQIGREALGVRRRVLGEEHPDTLRSAGNLASSLSRQGKYAVAERIGRDALGVRRRVQGEEHPETLASAGNLATTLANQDKFSEAEEMLQAALEAYRRVLGDAHPRTLECARSLENVQSDMHAEQPTRTAGKAAARRTERAATPSLSPTALAGPGGG
jgi:hypothetical protein